MKAKFYDLRQLDKNSIKNEAKNMDNQSDV